jgi:type IV pilus assembly protein PilY1
VTATDGFFDTAVVGDEGGQVWTVHFLDPGHVDSTSGLVDNWIFARAFAPEPSTSGTNDPRLHQPIFTLASTTVQPSNQMLRAFVGTGDRAHLRSSGGGDCRPDDPTSCVAMGCDVKSTMTIDNGPNSYTSTYASVGASSTSPAFAAPSQSVSTTSNACTSATAREVMTVSGPGCLGSFADDMTFSCSGSPLTCSDAQFKLPRPDTNRNLTTLPNTQQNFFMGLSILTSSIGAPDVVRKLDSAADVSAYDLTRLRLPTSSTAPFCLSGAGCLTDVTDTGATSLSTSGNLAGRDGAGWVVRYKNNIDEKTATGSALFNSCVVWSSLTPTGGAVGCGLNGSTSSTFQADAFTGAPNCVQSFLDTGLLQYTRFQTRNVIAPPPEAVATTVVGPGGRSVQSVVLGITPRPNGGAPVPQDVPRSAPSTDLLKLISSVPLTPDQHACRHGTDPRKCP